MKADQAEIVCISDNSTFFLIFLPSEQYEIGLPWVFSRKKMSQEDK